MFDWDRVKVHSKIEERRNLSSVTVWQTRLSVGLRAGPVAQDSQPQKFRKQKVQAVHKKTTVDRIDLCAIDRGVRVGQAASSWRQTAMQPAAFYPGQAVCCAAMMLRLGLYYISGNGIKGCFKDRPNRLCQTAPLGSKRGRDLQLPFQLPYCMNVL